MKIVFNNLTWKPSKAAKRIVGGFGWSLLVPLMFWVAGNDKVFNTRGPDTALCVGLMVTAFLLGCMISDLLLSD